MASRLAAHNKKVKKSRQRSSLVKMNQCDQITRDCEVIENLSRSCILFLRNFGPVMIRQAKTLQPPVNLSANDISAEFSRIHSSCSAIYIISKRHPEISVKLTLPFTRNRSDQVAKAQYVIYVKCRILLKEMASYMPALLCNIIRMLLFLLILFLNSSEGKDFSVGFVF